MFFRSKTLPASPGAILRIMALCFAVFAFVSCYSDPKGEITGDGDGDAQVMIGPDDEGVLVSEDGFVLLQFEKGTVTRDTVFRISSLPHDSYPDQYGLMSNVYLLEPSITLEKPVRLYFDLSGGITKDVSDVEVAPLFGSYAFSLKQIVPGKATEYVNAVEENLTLKEGESEHRVISYSTKELGAFAVYFNQCFKLCDYRVECSSYVLPEELANKREARIDCMKKLGCLSCSDSGSCSEKIDNLNNIENQEMFYCSPRRPCQDSMENGCCFEEDRCGIFEEPSEGDGDEESMSDQDKDPDIDGDVEEDGDLDADNGMDPDEDNNTGPDFSPRLCQDTIDCESGICVKDIPDFASGVCLPVAASEVRLYEEGSGKWDLVNDEVSGDPEVPDTSCVSIGPDMSSDGSSLFDMRVTVDLSWQMSDKEGITVKLYHANNLDVVQKEGVTDEDGVVTFTDAYAGQWMVIMTKRVSENPQVNIVETWDWGIFVSKPEAGEADLNQVPIDIAIHPVTQQRFSTFASALGITNGVPPGYGIVVGQVRDCTGELRAVENSVVGFLEATPFKTGYFNQDFSNPVPSQSFQATTRNGLFVGVYLPPEESLTGIAVGRARDAGGEGQAYTQILGKTSTGQLKVYRDSVSIVRFNTFH